MQRNSAYKKFINFKYKIYIKGVSVEFPISLTEYDTTFAAARQSSNNNNKITSNKMLLPLSTEMSTVYEKI